ncbi:hypothetical protein Tco_0494874 [Tanacetum coccineum]
MVKAKRNKLSSNFKKAAEEKFKEYDQKLEALSKINVPEAIEESVQAKVIYKEISLFTTPSPTTIDDLLEMELKIKLYNMMHQKKYSRTYYSSNKPRPDTKPVVSNIAETLKKGSPFAPDSEPPLRPYKLWKKARYEEAFRKSNQMHPTFEKSSLPKLLPKKIIKEDLECNVDKIKDEVGNPCPQSTPQAPPSFNIYTPHVTYPKEVDKTLGTPMEDEPLDQMKLEHVGLNNHSIFVSSKEVHSFDEPEP